MLEFCDELCVANTWFRKGEKRKLRYSSGENETEIDFVLVGKRHRKNPRDVKVIPGELHHRLVVMDLVKKKVNKVVRKEAIERRKVCKRHVMKYVGRRKGGEIKGTHGGGMRT